MSSKITRRNWFGLVGAGAAVAAYFPADTLLADTPAPNGAAPRAKSTIVLYMNGGPSHLDTFDPKPGTKAGGPTKAIATRVPGITISEHLPLLAGHTDKLAIVRSLTSKEGNHQRAQELARTGHVPNPTVKAPSLGAWVAKKRADAARAVPAFVSLGAPTIGAGFFGHDYDPFVVRVPGDPPDDLRPAFPLSASRESRRQGILDKMEGAFAARTGGGKVDERRRTFASALRFAASPEVSTFEIDGEPEATRAAYGDTAFGRACLVARRLVEAGVPYIEVTLDGWDTHDDVFGRTRKLMGILDPAMSSLLADLAARDLLRSTVVAWMGEFGRTPRINGNEGRDHHPRAFSAVVAGGGFRGGIVHGETDAEGGTVVKDPVTVPDLIATIGARAGIDQGSIEFTPAGRPISPTEEGKVIDAIVAS